MFLGSFQTRVDEKGRLKVPADFKRDLEETQKFFITSPDGKSAQMFPIREWLRKTEQVMKMPPSHPVRLKYMKATAYWGQVVDMDSQGRVLLPQKLRDAAKLMAEDVTVVGQMLGPVEPGFPGMLEVFNGKQYENEVEGSPLTQEELAQMAEFGA